MGPRMWIGLGLVTFAFLSYQCSTEYNPVTGEEQHLSLAPQQEIALGLQAMPEMLQQYGGEHPDQQAQAPVDQGGERIVAKSDAATTDWQTLARSTPSRCRAGRSSSRLPCCPSSRPKGSWRACSVTKSVTWSRDIPRSAWRSSSSRRA